MGSGEFSEWKAYYAIEPFGQERDNLHSAYICSMIANYSGKVKIAKKPEDFMFLHPEVKRQRETRRTLSMMKAIAKRV